MCLQHSKYSVYISYCMMTIVLVAKLDKDWPQLGTERCCLFCIQNRTRAEAGPQKCKSWLLGAEEAHCNLATSFHPSITHLPSDVSLGYLLPIDSLLLWRIVQLLLLHRDWSFSSANSGTSLNRFKSWLCYWICDTGQVT